MGSVVHIAKVLFGTGHIAKLNQWWPNCGGVAISAGLSAMGNAIEAAEFYGVPEFYVTHCHMEDAGGGCIRIYNFVSRGGGSIPVYSVVMPAQYLLGSSQRVSEIARSVLMGESAGRH